MAPASLPLNCREPNVNDTVSSAPEKFENKAGMCSIVLESKLTVLNNHNIYSTLVRFSSWESS